MAHSLWNLPERTGISQLDGQFADLRNLLLRILDLLETDPDGALPEYRLTLLSDKASAHFKVEEELHRTMGYPQLASHRTDHERILEKIRGNLVRRKVTGAPALMDLVEDFARLTQGHFETADRAFGQWLEQK